MQKGPGGISVGRKAVHHGFRLLFILHAEFRVLPSVLLHGLLPQLIDLFLHPPLGWGGVHRDHDAAVAAVLVADPGQVPEEVVLLGLHERAGDAVHLAPVVHLLLGETVDAHGVVVRVRDRRLCVQLLCQDPPDVVLRHLDPPLADAGSSNLLLGETLLGGR